jgi:hypothetical protein
VPEQHLDVHELSISSQALHRDKPGGDIGEVILGEEEAELLSGYR